MIVDPQSGAAIDEIGNGIHRIHIPVDLPHGGFSFNQYLVLDDEPLLFHTGPRRAFPLVRAAIEKVLPIERLRWIGFSHVENDECGAMNELLSVAPQALPVSGRVAAMTSADLFDRAPRVLSDGETLGTGRRTFRWLDVPNLPHNWECGYMLETSTETLLCGDLFTQPGARVPALTEGDILGPSEGMRRAFDYFSHTPETPAMLERLAALEPRTLACMHGSAWHGDGGKLLRELATAVAGYRGKAI